MERWTKPGAVGALALALTIAGAAQGACAQVSPGPYPTMAPRARYMMDRTAEVALARTAAPPALSKDASVLVLGTHGFETAATGTNGFTCLVERSWDKPFDDAEFWNPKMRGPICMNDAAVRTVLPMIVERAEWALAGVPRQDMPPARRRPPRRTLRRPAGPCPT